MKEQNPPETLQSLLKYEHKPGQVQRFLARMEKNFRWPSSMPEYLRRHSFRIIADVEFEFDDKVGFNFIFFYNALDRGEFTGHENEWVTIRIRIRRPNENNLIAIFSYDFYDTMNNNKKYTCVVDTEAPESILPFHVKRILGRQGWSTNLRRAGGYGAPAEQSKWVQAKILLWENDPGNQVEYALVGNDVTDKLAYVHEPGNSIKFLDIGDETRLTTFLNTRH
ncbi:hypothetical protein F8M41_016498 [Gigaspora margarita]|uniref:Uncharacterized protein n=1 Tax=Gigaspora margarita TaxID=4874 RepID=A0A8H4APP6_GIGMA|nr:hypothetical protein F8M41_016498 [Gigaspora margarita]